VEPRAFKTVQGKKRKGGVTGVPIIGHVNKRGEEDQTSLE